MPRLPSHKAPEGQKLLNNLRDASAQDIDALVNSKSPKELLRQVLLILRDSAPRAPVVDQKQRPHKSN